MRERVQSGIARMGMVCALGLMVCAVMLGQDVKSNAMPGVDFSKYHTYKWVAIEGGTHPNQIADAEIKQAVDTQLQAKGLTKTDSDKADLLVGYQVAVDQQKQWNAYGGGDSAWEAVWPARPVQPSTLAVWFWTCMTLQLSSLFGLVPPQRLLTPVATSRRTRRTLTRLWRNY